MPSEPLFNLASYARRGPARREHLSREEIAQISRTARRSPEVMVKVLGRGGQDLKSVHAHLNYIRLREDGEVPIETDDGLRLEGGQVTQELLEEWDLNLDSLRPGSNLDAHGGGSKKLVHKLMFSMPAGTPPEKVLGAVKNLAREEFALKHRYAMVLHTDEPHPHVHMIVKAVGKHGDRLHIRKATLREWRGAFARHLRALGVSANATDRYIRGETIRRKPDGIYRADVRGTSTHMRERREAVARELREGELSINPGKTKLMKTRADVATAWNDVSNLLVAEGQSELAAQVKRFIGEMSPPQTDNERLAADVRVRPHQRSPSRLPVAR